jgi:hypothetical protein
MQVWIMTAMEVESLHARRVNRWLVVTAVVLVGAVVALGACGASETSSAPSAASATSLMATVAGPFKSADVRDLVLQESEGNGLVEGLLYRPTYSGTAQLTDVRHWTLVPPERLQAVGFADAYVSMFFTDDFFSTFGKAGRSFLTTALLFESPEGAADALQVLADSRDELWEEWQPLAAVPGANGIAQTGRLGTDNVADIYPATSFAIQVANVCLLIGSEGGAESGEPLPEDLMRSAAEQLLARAEAQLVEIQN